MSYIQLISSFMTSVIPIKYKNIQAYIYDPYIKPLNLLAELTLEKWR